MYKRQVRKYITKGMRVMVKEDLLTKIENAMPGLSKSQRAIGDFIIKNYDKSAYLTASKLGLAIGVSESTVCLLYTCFTGIGGLNAFLPVPAALILIGISVLLTLLSGIIPSRSAAKKDPVVALRTE